jgi:pyrimidine operon attenuation protein / uracil phosphoribosyltransferase
MEKKLLFNKEVAAKKIERIALEIVERIGEENPEILLLGVQKNGPAIAEKLAVVLRNHKQKVLVETLTIDKQTCRSVSVSGDTNYSNKSIIVVDDVSNSGKTLLYAIKPLLDQFPKRIQIAVLVERMHKQFPVTPDYVGQSVATTQENHIEVEVENGEVTGAYLL